MLGRAGLMTGRFLRDLGGDHVDRSSRSVNSPTAVLDVQRTDGFAGGMLFLEPRVASGLPSGTQRVFRGLDAAAAGSAGRIKRRVGAAVCRAGLVGGG